jgi:uncharacterized protein YyaL (SSP411 family)
MTQNLIRLFHLTGNDRYRADADAIIHASSPAVANNLFAAVGMLNALDLRLAATDVVITAPSVPDAAAMAAIARRRATPSHLITVHAGAIRVPPSHPAFGRPAVDGKPTAYICRGETCSLPVTDPDQLARILTTGDRT